ncbi:MAG: hypothetical protein R2838_12265 [Caldilineaceae bacterium]
MTLNSKVRAQSLGQETVPRHLLAHVADGHEQRHLHLPVDQHVIDQVRTVGVVQVHVIRAGLRVAEDARAVCILLLVDPLGRLRVLLRDEQPVHHALAERLAPVDVDIDAQQAVALGLTFENPQDGAIVAGLEGRHQPFADDHALGADDRLLKTGEEARDQRAELVVVQIGQAHADVTGIDRVGPRPEEVVEIGGAVHGEEKFAVAQPVAHLRREFVVVDAQRAVQHGVEEIHVSRPPRREDARRP